MLMAATGVGAGDLLTGGLAGSRHGVTLLWAAWVGALVKWFLNEGLARWQMATGTTLLEGWVTRLGRWIRWAFVIYLVPWAFFTGGALANACGIAATGMLPLGSDLQISKISWAILHSIAGVVLVLRGGFRAFERLMLVCTGLMFIGVVFTAPLLSPDLGEVLRGLFVPTIPEGGTAYAIGVMGGVGGTVTLLSYGYWVREKGRTGQVGAAECRIDLAAGYLMTALFGISIIIIGSRTALVEGPSAALELADQLALVLGPAGRWLFLAGFWGAVFSSLLGVWQSVPYMFADFTALARKRDTPVVVVELSQTRAYRAFLLFIATVPLVMLWASLERVQLLYSVFAAFFMPLLALTLLIMNTRIAWVGRDLRSGWVTNAALLATLVLFAYLSSSEIVSGLTTIVSRGGR